MPRKAEPMLEVIAGLVAAVDRINVGKSADYQNKRNTNGKADGKRALTQHLS